MLGLRLFDGSDAETVRLRVFGMACEYCRDTVETVLEDLETVRSATVSLEEKMARVETEGEIDARSLVEQVRLVGYEARLA